MAITQAPASADSSATHLELDAVPISIARAHAKPSPCQTLAAGTMDFSFFDARKLESQAWNNDHLLDKKRRWLMGPETSSTSGGCRKKRKTPKFFKELYLPESFVRESTSSAAAKVSNDVLISSVERSCGFFSDKQANSGFLLLDAQKMDSDDINSYTPEKLLMMIADLNDDALRDVARILTQNKGTLNISRSKMKKIIDERLPKFLEVANAHSWPYLKHLLIILRKQTNFKVKNCPVNAPVSQSLVSSIYSMLEGLHEMPFQEIDAMNRKLRGVAQVPQFPPLRTFCKKDLLIPRVMRKYKKYLSNLKEGDKLPEPLAKALLIFHLSFKYRRRAFEPLVSELFLFPPEILSLQNDITRALWSLEKVDHEDLKALQSLVNPEAKVSLKTLRIALKKYLLECLFESTELVMTEEILRTVNFLNGRSQHRLPKEAREEDVKAVMNISCQLKQILSSLLLDCSIEDSHEFEISGGIYGKEDSYSEPFDVSSSEFSISPEWENSQLHGSGANFEAVIKENPAKRHIELDCFNDELTVEHSDQHSDFETAMSKNESQLEIVCNETALISYKLIDSVLDKLLRCDDKEVNKTARSYLHGGLPFPPHFPVTEDMTQISENDLRAYVLNETIKELIPSFQERCNEKVKNVMELAQCSP